jgi:hypothetical protein
MLRRGRTRVQILNRSTADCRLCCPLHIRRAPTHLPSPAPSSAIPPCSHRVRTGPVPSELTSGTLGRGLLCPYPPRNTHVVEEGAVRVQGKRGVHGPGRVHRNNAAHGPRLHAQTLAQHIHAATGQGLPLRPALAAHSLLGSPSYPPPPCGTHIEDRLESPVPIKLTVRHSLVQSATPPHHGCERG